MSKLLFFKGYFLVGCLFLSQCALLSKPCNFGSDFWREDLSNANAPANNNQALLDKIAKLKKYALCRKFQSWVCKARLEEAKKQLLQKP